MITCYLKYVIDPYKLSEFETYAKLWIPLVNKFGGTHNGYFLPSEGANNIALALFTFPSLAEYEKYRANSFQDPDCIAAFKYAEETKCIISYERSFFKPIFE
ncbi:NIPSNAP family containing protein [Pseudoalteromonas luteoviolacea CPMOR-1]|uniref:NIPSNAP family containing protein n=1 Tax=Pseudoalteromonas luteoviolacea CPMOR-1 TaxID=1365248 RepID=A0A167MH88_9GAMM|nr:NIPSNAP family protein [Pseudoalteromonas luteoviolacea]KZN66416.1 NIPSNAP family containing protein [Pseudoalteromonas luteoviolacea CPMOR-1]